MLFSYKGIDSEYKYKRGMIEANTQFEAMDKIKETEGVIIIIHLKKTSNSKILNRMRVNFNVRLENIENRLNNRTNRIVQKDKQKQKSKKKRKAGSELLEKSPILRGLNKLRSVNISLPGGRGGSKKIVMDEDMYTNLQNMFKERESSDDTDSEYNVEVSRNENLDTPAVDLGESKIKKADRKQKRDKSAGKEIDWSLIENNENDPEVKGNMKIKVKEKEVIMFTRRLHIMLSSGVPLLSSLVSLQETSSKEMSKVLASVTEDIQLGHSFSEAIAKFPRQFNTTYVALVSIGETSGSLQKSLKDILRVKDQEQKVSRKIKVASVYPVVIGIVLAVFMSAAYMFFIPEFSKHFEGLDMELPQFTQFIFGIGAFFPYIFGTIAVIVIVFLFLKKNIPEVNYMYKRYADKIKLKMPVIKNVTNASYMHSFSSNIALMLDNGIRLSDTLSLTGRTINNIYIKNEIEDVANLMVHGLTFSEALREQENFDEILINIALTGEKSGKMVFSLNQVSEYYEQELSRQIDALLELVQPLSILLIGLTIAPIIIAAYLPILDMSSGAGLF